VIFVASLSLALGYSQLIGVLFSVEAAAVVAIVAARLVRSHQHGLCRSQVIRCLPGSEMSHHDM
jgi:hypothetical protein